MARITASDGCHLCNEFVGSVLQRSNALIRITLQGTSMFSLISQLSHVEFTTPKPQESLRFFVDILGMIETARRGQSVY